MARTLRIYFDPKPGQPFFEASIAAVDHAADALGVDVDVEIVATADITSNLVSRPGDAVFVGPGSPWENPRGVEDVIRTAREQGIPLVGT